MDRTAEVDVELHMVFPENHRLPRTVQRENPILVGTESLAHAGNILEQVVLPVQLKGVKAVFTHMMRRSGILPENLLSVQNPQLQVFRRISAWKQERLQLHRLRLSVVGEIPASQGFQGPLPGFPGHAVLVHPNIALIEDLLSVVSAPANGQIQAVLGFPLSPWLVVRQKRILRDRASARQGNVPAGPVLRFKNSDTTPRPGAPGQGGKASLRGPEDGLLQPAMVLPQHLTRLPVYDLQILRGLYAADILAAGPLGPGLKASIR